MEFIGSNLVYLVYCKSCGGVINRDITQNDLVMIMYYNMEAGGTADSVTTNIWYVLFMHVM